MDTNTTHENPTQLILLEKIVLVLVGTNTDQGHRACLSLLRGADLAVLHLSCRGEIHLEGELAAEEGTLRKEDKR